MCCPHVGARWTGIAQCGGETMRTRCRCVMVLAAAVVALAGGCAGGASRDRSPPAAPQAAPLHAPVATAQASPTTPSTARPQASTAVPATAVPIISPVRPDNRPTPVAGDINGEMPTADLIGVAHDCVAARAAA